MFPSRIINYYRRHGLRMTLQRAWTRTVHALVQNRVFLYSVDLTACDTPPPAMQGGLRVERTNTEADINDCDKKAMLEYWDAKETQSQIVDRFGKGATLWLIKDGDRLAGFGWTLLGTTIEPHWVPIEPDDVHLFDFEVFPMWRGRGINPALVEQVLFRTARDGAKKAFIEVHEWNHPQVRSLAKTRFERYGIARRSLLFGRWRVAAVQRGTGLP